MTTYLLTLAAMFFAVKWINALEREAVLSRDYAVTCEDNAKLTAQLEASDKAVVTAAIAVRDAERRVGGRQFQTEQNWSEQ